jgi:hypothetical protein
MLRDANGLRGTQSGSCSGAMQPSGSCRDKGAFCAFDTVLDPHHHVSVTNLKNDALEKELLNT